MKVKPKCVVEGDTYRKKKKNRLKHFFVSDNVKQGIFVVNGLSNAPGLCD